MTETVSVGEALVALLERRGVDTVFGIPGVHTVELYRGLKASSIRHVTPRHELSAGFMADGYARVSGKPGVCLLITGPGVANAITAMGQARADSIPMLIIAGVNPVATQGHEEGHLHELPDQLGLMRQVAVHAQALHSGTDLEAAVARAFRAMTAARPGPVVLEIPLDVMDEQIALPGARSAPANQRHPDPDVMDRAATVLTGAEAPLILAGGGALAAEEGLKDLAERLDAPVITTINARALMAGHPLAIPASPSLPVIRELMAGSDVTLAVGTQIGPTDFDIYAEGVRPSFRALIRIDLDPLQMTRGALPDIGIEAEADLCIKGLLARLTAANRARSGADRAQAVRQAAFAGLSPEYARMAQTLQAISTALPGCILVGDSTQPVYAGNMYLDLDPGARWFNSSTGFGALGYGAPAAIGAALADPARPVVCITGDGGFQYCLSELGTAMDEGVPVLFLVWNNAGYQEIETYMRETGVPPIGVRPSPPEFAKIAEAYGIATLRTDRMEALPTLLAEARESGAPMLVEFDQTG